MFSFQWCSIPDITKHTLLNFLRFWCCEAWRENQICKWSGKWESAFFGVCTEFLVVPSSTCLIRQMWSYCSIHGLEARNVYLSWILCRNSKHLVPPTLTPVKLMEALKPNTSGQSMDWPLQRNGILTIPSEQKLPLKIRCVHKLFVELQNNWFLIGYLVFSVDSYLWSPS